jgi:hypothetical protein
MVVCDVKWMLRNMDQDAPIVFATPHGPMVMERVKATGDGWVIVLMFPMDATDAADVPAAYVCESCGATAPQWEYERFGRVVCPCGVPFGTLSGPPEVAGNNG